MRCPSCNKQITADSDKQWQPFCSSRCQLVDLGDWLNENHRIPSEDMPDDLSELKDDDRTH